MKNIDKFGLVTIKNDSILLCRPHAFPDLITIGGTKEGNESYVENLTREVYEELGCNAVIDIESLKYFGRFVDRAAGRSERTVTIDLYIGEIFGDLRASSEIAELVWYRPYCGSYVLSDIVKNKIVPALIATGALNWNSIAYPAA